MEGKKIGAAAVIVDDDGQVLLVKQTYGRLDWELPGGAAEAGESPDETVVREVREETGLDVAVLHLTGYYHDADTDFLHFVFLCENRAGHAARPDLAEVSECGYWPPHALPRPISDFTTRRIQDALAGVRFRLPSHVGPRVWLE
jgi:8-oxo-dGTP diphosphatase